MGAFDSESPGGSNPAGDLHRLRAAEGWIELGLLEEARAELAEMGAELRNGADGLEVQWRLFAELGQWEAAFAIAEQTVKLHPDSDTTSMSPFCSESTAASSPAYGCSGFCDWAGTVCTVSANPAAFASGQRGRIREAKL